MNIHALTLGPFATNCYLVWARYGREALLVDCAGDAGPILDAARERGLTIALIVVTHGHVDHIEALASLVRETGAAVAVHELDAPMLGDCMLSGAALFGLPQEQARADRLVGERDLVSVEGLTFTVLHTPGHTPGSICLLGEQTVFSGDCLFAGGIGRVDLPGGDEAAMLRSLARLMELPDGLAVYPGHGPPTTIAAEREGNPWLAGL